MIRPRLLDLFCCEGGAARGYDQAGFDVYGVDLFTTIKDGFSRKRYPYPALQEDVPNVLWHLVHGYPVQFDTGQWLGLESFAAIHASPPCQRYSSITRRHGRQEQHADLIDSTRKDLDATGLPYIIENVAGAPLNNPTLLCGSMFGLGATWHGQWRYLRRHRIFESNIALAAPSPCQHGSQAIGIYGNPGGSSKRDGLSFPDAAAWAVALGIDGMSAKGMAQSIPPAYTQHLGRQMLDAQQLHSIQNGRRTR